MEVREARGGAEAAEEAAPSTGQPGCGKKGIQVGLNRGLLKPQKVV